MRSQMINTMRSVSSFRFHSMYLMCLLNTTVSFLRLARGARFFVSCSSRPRSWIVFTMYGRNMSMVMFMIMLMLIQMTEM